MGTPALDELLAQGRYTFDVALTALRTSITSGDGPLPATRTEIVLAASSRALPGQFQLPLSVRIVGPVDVFDRTVDGKAVVGFCRVMDGACEIGLVGTAAFVQHCLSVIPGPAPGRSFLSLTTEQKLEHVTENFVVVLDAEISWTTPSTANRQ